MTLQRTCVTCPATAIFIHPSCLHRVLVNAGATTTHDDTQLLYSILFVYFTLVVELRSSGMSGATDGREDEQVPQFYGHIDETIVAKKREDP